MFSTQTSPLWCFFDARFHTFSNSSSESWTPMLHNISEIQRGGNIEVRPRFMGILVSIFKKILVISKTMDIYPLKSVWMCVCGYVSVCALIAYSKHIPKFQASQFRNHLVNVNDYEGAQLYQPMYKAPFESSVSDRVKGRQPGTSWASGWSRL